MPNIISCTILDVHLSFMSQLIKTIGTDVSIDRDFFKSTVEFYQSCF